MGKPCILSKCTTGPVLTMQLHTRALCKTNLMSQDYLACFENLHPSPRVPKNGLTFLLGDTVLPRHNSGRVLPEELYTHKAKRAGAELGL